MSTDALPDVMDVHVFYFPGSHDEYRTTYTLTAGSTILHLKHELVGPHGPFHGHLTADFGITGHPVGTPLADADGLIEDAEYDAIMQ